MAAIFICLNMLGQVIWLSFPKELYYSENFITFVVGTIELFNSSPLVPHICVSELGQNWIR